MRKEEALAKDAESAEVRENSLSEKIIGAALAVHKGLGPGLLESAYEKALAYQLVRDGLIIECQKIVPVTYDGVVIDDGFRADIIVNDLVILEIKSVKRIEDVHLKQLLTYLRLSGKKLGLLINFNETLLKQGIKRIANNL